MSLKIVFLGTPDFALPSLRMLLEKGYEMTMVDNFLKIYDKQKRLIIRESLSKNRTFKVGIQVFDQHCLKASTESDEWL